MGMDTKELLHPLERSKLLAALAAMVFWGTGVGLLSPRFGIGILLCSLSVICTLWIYWEAFTKMDIWHPRTWPILAILLLAIQIGVPGYIALSRAQDTAKTSSSSQSGGQTAETINNNGPVYNGQSEARSDCRIQHNTFDIGTIQSSATGIRIEGSGVCNNNFTVHKMINVNKAVDIHSGGPPPNDHPGSVSGNCNMIGNNNNFHNFNCPTYAPQLRVISDAVASMITKSALATGPHRFSVWLTGNDADVGPYSFGLISSLNKAGWIGNFAGATMSSFPPPSDVGLHLCGKLAIPPEAANILLNILLSNHQDVSRTYAPCDKFGANFAGSPAANFDEDTVGIIVGRDGPSSP